MVTGDADLKREHGLEVLVETARMWVSAGRFDVVLAMHWCPEAFSAEQKARNLRVPEPLLPEPPQPAGRGPRAHRPSRGGRNRPRARRSAADRRATRAVSQRIGLPPVTATRAPEMKDPSSEASRT
jgi:hypothetical protein